MKIYALNAYGGQHCIFLKKNRYAGNNNLAIEMCCIEDGNSEMWDSLTTNFDITLPANQAFVRKDKYSAWIIEQNIGRPVGMTIQSGFCQYDLFEFHDNIYSNA